MKKFISILVMTCLLGFVGCRNHNNSMTRDNLLETLNNLGENSDWLDGAGGWELVKSVGAGENKNWAVFYSDYWDEFYAVDMTAWAHAQNNGIPIDTFLDAGYEASYYGEGPFSTATVQEVWESNDSGFFIGDYTGMIFEETTASAKDLERIGSFLEKKNLHKKASHLESQFGLSEKRSFEVAKLLTNIKTVSKSRNITSKDMDAFSKKLLGFNFNEATTAYTSLAEGESHSWEELMKKAAQTNGLSPESMKDIFSSLLK
jgi:hypothetical protein